MTAMIRKTLPEAAAWLRQNDCYLLLTHRRPDGDTIGSAAALCRGLRQLGRAAWLLENPEVTPKYAPYLTGLTVPAPPEGATVLAIDTASPACCRKTPSPWQAMSNSASTTTARTRATPPRRWSPPAAPPAAR